MYTCTVGQLKTFDIVFTCMTLRYVVQVKVYTKKNRQFTVSASNESKLP